MPVKGLNRPSYEEMLADPSLRGVFQNGQRYDPRVAQEMQAARADMGTPWRSDVPLTGLSLAMTTPNPVPYVEPPPTGRPVAAMPYRDVGQPWQPQYRPLPTQATHGSLFALGMPVPPMPTPTPGQPTTTAAQPPQPAMSPLQAAQAVRTAYTKSRFKATQDDTARPVMAAQDFLEHQGADAAFRQMSTRRRGTSRQVAETATQYKELQRRFDEDFAALMTRHANQPWEGGVEALASQVQALPGYSDAVHQHAVSVMMQSMPEDLKQELKIKEHGRKNQGFIDANGWGADATTGRPAMVVVNPVTGELMNNPAFPSWENAQTAATAHQHAKDLLEERIEAQKQLKEMEDRKKAAVAAQKEQEQRKADAELAYKFLYENDPLRTQAQGLAQPGPDGEMPKQLFLTMELSKDGNTRRIQAYDNRKDAVNAGGKLLTDADLLQMARTGELSLTTNQMDEIGWSHMWTKKPEMVQSGRQWLQLAAENRARRGQTIQGQRMYRWNNLKTGHVEEIPETDFERYISGEAGQAMATAKATAKTPAEADVPRGTVAPAVPPVQTKLTAEQIEKFGTDEEKKAIKQESDQIAKRAEAEAYLAKPETQETLARKRRLEDERARTMTELRLLGPTGEGGMVQTVPTGDLEENPAEQARRRIRVRLLKDKLAELDKELARYAPPRGTTKKG